MLRRDFLSIAAAASAAPLSRASNDAGQRTVSAPISHASAGEHAQRLSILAECARSVRKCLRRRVVLDYLPGQVFYHLGDYPNTRPWRDPDESDEAQLEEHSRAGIELVQVHMDWADTLGLFGGSLLAPQNKKGFRRFVELCHRYKLKVIPYISTGYFETRDPDFRPEWAASQANEVWYRLARCSPESPGWRAYLLPRLARILDEYGVDGFYNDVGYSPQRRNISDEDEGLGVNRGATSDAAFEDLLGLVYDTVKRRGGVVKVHAGVWYRASRRPPESPRLYDYLWVGETPADPDAQREAVKDHPPYLVPCMDLARTQIASEDDLYLHSIPYLQFPILLAGRPMTGESMFVPGLKYKEEPPDPAAWTRSRHYKKIREHYLKHPKGPYSYGPWDSCPGRSEARPAYYRWLKLYRAMVEPGTHAYLEVRDSDLLAGAVPSGLTASVFANRNLYVALANYSSRDVIAETRAPFRSTLEESVTSRTWRIKARSLTVLKRL